MNGDDVVAVRQAAWVAYWDRIPELQRAAATCVLDGSGRTTAAVRAAAAVGLGEAVIGEHVTALVAIVDDEAEDAGVRAACLGQAGGAVEPAQLAEICERAYRSGDRRLRHVAVDTMPSGPRLEDFLDMALEDPDPWVCYAAGWRRRSSR